MRAVLRDAATRQWRLFERPVELVVAFQLSEVIPALERIERATAEGLHAAGFIAYEAAPAFDVSGSAAVEGTQTRTMVRHARRVRALSPQTTQHANQSAAAANRNGS